MAQRFLNSGRDSELKDMLPLSEMERQDERHAAGVGGAIEKHQVTYYREQDIRNFKYAKTLPRTF